MDTLKLYYFDIRGKGEFLHLLLRAADQKYEEIIVTRQTPYGQLPYMVWKGKTYAQSLAMATFLAKKLGYCGDSDEDALRVDEVIQLCDDIRNPWIRDWYFAKDEKKVELTAKIKDELVPRYFGYFEKLLKDNGGTGFFVGKRASLADFVIYDFIDTILGIDPKALEPFRCLQKLRSNVKAIPTQEIPGREDLL